MTAESGIILQNIVNALVCSTVADLVTITALETGSKLGSDGCRYIDPGVLNMLQALAWLYAVPFFGFCKSQR